MWTSKNCSDKATAACTEKVCLDMVEVVRDGPTILRKKMEDLREARAKAMPSAGAQVMRTLLGSGRPSARRDQLRPVSPDK